MPSLCLMICSHKCTQCTGLQDYFMEYSITCIISVNDFLWALVALFSQNKKMDLWFISMLYIRNERNKDE